MRTSSPGFQFTGVATVCFAVSWQLQAIEGVDELLRRLNGEQIGRRVTVAVLRGGKRVEVSLTPSERGS